MKKISSIVLCLVMLCSLLPAAACAEDIVPDDPSSYYPEPLQADEAPSYEKGSGEDLQIPIDGLTLEDFDPDRERVFVDEGQSGEIEMRYIDSFDHIEELPDEVERTVDNSNYYTTEPPRDNEIAGLIITIWHQFLELIGLGDHSLDILYPVDDVGEDAVTVEDPVTPVVGVEPVIEDGSAVAPVTEGCVQTAEETGPEEEKLSTPFRVTGSNDVYSGEEEPVSEWINGTLIDNDGEGTAFRFTFDGHDIDFVVHDILNADGSSYKGDSTVTGARLRKEGDIWVIQFLGGPELEGKTVDFGLGSYGESSDTGREILNTFFNYDEFLYDGTYTERRPYQGMVVCSGETGDDIALSFAAMPAAGIGTGAYLAVDGSLSSRISFTIADLGISTAVGVSTDSGIGFDGLFATVGENTSLRLVNANNAAQPLLDGQIELVWATVPGGSPLNLTVSDGSLVSVDINGSTSPISAEQIKVIMQGLQTASAYDSNGQMLSLPANSLPIWNN